MRKNAKPIRRVAFGGITSALSLVCMFLSSLLPFAEYTCPALAGIALTALVIDFGKRTAYLAYAVVALLSLIIVPNKESALLFLFFFGYYPILKASLEQIHPRILEWAAKLAVFNAAILAAYWLMINALGMSQVLEDAAFAGFSLRLSLLLLLLLGNVTFVLFDHALTRLIALYCAKLRPRLQKHFR